MFYTSLQIKQERTYVRTDPKCRKTLFLKTGSSPNSCNYFFFILQGNEGEKVSQDIIFSIRASLWRHTTPEWEWVKTKNLKLNVSEHNNPFPDLHDNVGDYTPANLHTEIFSITTVINNLRH